MQLFDGSTLANWRMCGRGTFHAIDGALQSVPSFDLGLLWCTIPMPQNYRLELDFLVRLFNTNSGDFVRFRNPELAGMANNAWSAVGDGWIPDRCTRGIVQQHMVYRRPGRVQPF